MTLIASPIPFSLVPSKDDIQLEHTWDIAISTQDWTIGNNITQTQDVISKDSPAYGVGLTRYRTGLSTRIQVQNRTGLRGSILNRALFS